MYGRSQLQTVYDEIVEEKREEIINNGRTQPAEKEDRAKQEDNKETANREAMHGAWMKTNRNTNNE